MKTLLLLLAAAACLAGQPKDSLGIQSYQAPGTGATTRSGHDKLADSLNPMDFGCKGNGIADDTACWTAAITAAIAQGKALVCTGQTFLVSKQGTTTFVWDGITHPYVFLITSPISISGPCFVKVDVTDANTANVFVFQLTQHVRISGLTFTGTGTQTTQVLYGGAAVAFDRCNDCYGADLKTFTMRGNLLAFNSSEVGCSHCFSAATPPNATWPAAGSGGKQGSHWAAYACTNAVFSENTGYGGTTDADLNFFGYTMTYPALGNKAVNNHLYNYAFGDATKTIVYNNAQGFGIDSGQTGALMQGNYAYGYYYCFDVKTQSNGAVVIGNTAEKCKVGVDVRLGETPIINQSAVVSGNTIRPLGGNGNSVSFGGLTATLGVWIQDSFGVTVDNNVIEASWTFGSGVQDFIPVYAQISSTSAYWTTIQQNSPLTNGINIHDNILAMAQQQGATYTYSDNSAVVIAGNSTNHWPSVKVDNNIIKFRTDAHINAVPIVASYAENIDISGNHFGLQPGVSGLYSITCTTCTMLTVNDNKLNQLGGFLSATSSTMITARTNVMYQQTRDLSTNPIPLFLSTTSTNWTIIGNIRMQPASNVDNGLFFLGTSTTGLVMTGNIMDQEIFEANYYTVNGVMNPTTGDIMADNIRLGPIFGATEVTKLPPVLMGSPFIALAPVRTDASKNLITGKIDVGNATDILGTGLSTSHPVGWNGSILVDYGAVVQSFASRTGTVVPTAGDYSFSQITSQVSCSQLPGAGGASATATVRNAAGTGTCTITFSCGLVTGSSC